MKDTSLILKSNYVSSMEWLVLFVGLKVFSQSGGYFTVPAPLPNTDINPM